MTKLKVGHDGPVARHIVKINDVDYYAFIKEITNDKGEAVKIIAYSIEEHKITIGEKEILHKRKVPENLPDEIEEGSGIYSTKVPVNYVEHKVKIGTVEYYAYYEDGQVEKGNPKRIVAYSPYKHYIDTEKDSVEALRKLPTPKRKDLQMWSKIIDVTNNTKDKFLSSETPQGIVSTSLQVPIDGTMYYAYYDKTPRGYIRSGETIIAYSLTFKDISLDEYNKLKGLESPNLGELKYWKTSKDKIILSSRQPEGSKEITKTEFDAVVKKTATPAVEEKPAIPAAAQPASKTAAPVVVQPVPAVVQAAPVAKQPEKAAVTPLVVPADEEPKIAVPAQQQSEKQSVVAEPKPEVIASNVTSQLVPEVVQATPVQAAQPDEGPKQEPHVVAAPTITPSEPVTVSVQQPVLQQPEPEAQHDEGAKQEQVSPVLIQPVEEPEPQVTVHAPATVVQIVTPEPGPAVVSVHQPVEQDEKPKDVPVPEVPAKASDNLEKPKRWFVGDEIVFSTVQPEGGIDLDDESFKLPESNEALKDNIKKQILSFFHRTLNDNDQKMINYIVKEVVDKRLDYQHLTPKSLHTLIKNLIKDYKTPPAGSISETAIAEAQKVITFDSVWEAVDSSFKVHKNDYDALRRHVEPIREKDALVKFINSFKDTVGGNNKISRSQLFTKDFSEAMELCQSDPEGSKLLLDNLKKDKAYDPAKLCKAYVSCMKDIQDYRKTLGYREKGEDKIKYFIYSGSEFLKGNDISDKSLSELRDKLIPNTEFLSSPKVKPNEFAKEFDAQFPTLYRVFESMVDDKSVPKEMQKLVREIANKLKVEDPKLPNEDPYLRVLERLSKLEVTTRSYNKLDNDPLKYQKEEVSRFLSTMEIELPRVQQPSVQR